MNIITQDIKNFISYNKPNNLDVAKNYITCITLSKEPFVRSDIQDIPYYNHVSTFLNARDQILQRRLALDSVKTKLAFFCDSDDPFPEHIPNTDKALLFGNFNIINKTSLDTSLKVYSCANLINKREDIDIIDLTKLHNPIFNVEKIKNVIDIFLEYLPNNNNYASFTWIYYLMRFVYDFEYDPNFKAYWIKYESGVHTNYVRPTVSTRCLIMDIRDILIRELS